MSTCSLLVVLLLLSMVAPVLAEDPPVEPPTAPDWTISVDNHHPFLGDPVVIEVWSIYVGEYATLEFFEEGVRVQQMVVRTNTTREQIIIWETRLDMTPGAYRISLMHYGIEEANATVTLVYDPVDYALKSIRAHEEDMARLRERDGLAEEWATLALTQNDYERRWRIFGAIVDTLALIIIIYLGPQAWRKYVEGGIERGGEWWTKWGGVMTTHVDGTLNWSMGKETMMDTPQPREPKARESAWCEECQVLIHVTEWRDHPHDLKFAKVKGPVRPTRVVKEV